MIDAVSSVLSSAPQARIAAHQQSAVAASFVPDTTSAAQHAVAQAPYISLYIKVDVNFDKAILQMRDQDTGDVVRQIPSETQLEAYRRAQKVVAPSIQDITAEDESKTDSSSAPTSTDTDLDVSSSSDTVPAPKVTAPQPSTTKSVDTSA